jgi:BMFP domain-containing protein YqiC
VTDRLKRELEAAIADLENHMASWEYAYAMAGGPNGGGDHPIHAETRRRTEVLHARVRDLRARIAEHEL